MTSNFNYLHEQQDEQLEKLIETYEYNLINNNADFNYGNHGRQILEYVTAKYVSETNKSVSGRIPKCWEEKYKDELPKSILNIINLIRTWGNETSHSNFRQTYKLGWAEYITILKHLWYSLNFIFKKENFEFDESFYLKTKTDLNLKKDQIINQKINIKIAKSYNGTFTEFKGYLNKNHYKILRWKDYAHKWEDFIKKYQNFYFGANSYFAVITWGHQESRLNNEQLFFKTSEIKELTNVYDLISIASKSRKLLASQSIIAKLQIFHDNNDIYLTIFIDEFSTFAGTSVTVNFKVNNIIFK
ncbi:hypothetical protein [Spiroplasma eriocheiris]|uniref:DUF4145 domain-containing protein n=1 Tax=Spiroplasma eriocheiris TaxID=315358 RepID=A0A0H3XHG3_9MOLU|nr:hypothetical protein [Spiroplasma eriocheiris]AHF57687.1 hypothetical protein SPE_0559 [Spiroplasma eriocheiris CCTCC M 207170]AKM54138.1 hypothetical protein SERIO_v1c05670 [Spiroplasma eriocheiris]